MKRETRFLSCLLAGVLALAVLAGCSGTIVGTVRTDSKQAAQLMEQIDTGLTYSAELESAAERLADWMVEDAAKLGTRSGLLARSVELTADSGNMIAANVNDFIDASSDWLFLPQGVTIGLAMDNTSQAFTGYLYAPPQSGAGRSLRSYASGCSRMGAVFIEYGGETYVVALFA